MKCLVFSDSHGNPYYMKKAIMNHADAEVIFFLGDGLRDIIDLENEFKDKAFLKVMGNCDSSIYSYLSQDKISSITLLDKKIVYTHGDLYRVKYSTEGIMAAAEGREADLILYGHTHIPELKYINSEGKQPYYIFNPGSIGYGDHSYGIITLNDSGILLSHGRVN